jgi:hypothetical protein
MFVLLGEFWKSGLRIDFFDKGLHINIDVQVMKSLPKRVDRVTVESCFDNIIQ